MQGDLRAGTGQQASMEALLCAQGIGGRVPFPRGLQGPGQQGVCAVCRGRGAGGVGRHGQRAAGRPVVLVRWGSVASGLRLRYLTFSCLLF
jgi:hypothetical protein